MPVVIDGLKFDAIVDTGANKTVIDCDVTAALNCTVQPYKGLPLFTAANEKFHVIAETIIR